MKRCLLPLLYCALLGSGAAVQAAPALGRVPKMIYARAPLVRIDPLAYPQFRGIDAELRNMVRRHGDRTVANGFCVVGYQLDGGTLETVLVWDNAQWLVRWWGSDASAPLEERDEVSASFSPVTDLRTDLVEDTRFPLGTRAVVRADAEALLADCQQFGRQYTVGPLPPDDEDAAY